MIDRVSGRVSIPSGSLAARPLSKITRAEMSDRSESKFTLKKESESGGRASDVKRLHAQLYAGVTRRDFASGQRLGERMVGFGPDVTPAGIKATVASATFDQVVFLMSVLLMDAATSERLHAARQTFDDVVQVCEVVGSKREAVRMAKALQRKELEQALKGAYREYDEELEKLINGVRRTRAINRALQTSLAARITAERRAVAKTVSRFYGRRADSQAEVPRSMMA